MKILLLLLALFSWMNASNLLTYNVYERDDRVDVMLSFDSPHEGTISQKNDANSITLIISDLSYDKMVEKSINSGIIQDLSIVPEKNNALKIILKSNKNINVVASKTVDGFGLRIRSNIAPAASQRSSDSTKTALTSTDSSSSDSIETRYIIVIIVLLIMVIFMLWIKRRMGIRGMIPSSTNISGKGKSWLFNPKTSSNQEVTLLHKKPIDNQNSVVLFEYGNITYLVMTGNSNVLLEKFQNGEVKNDSEFEKVFEENRRRLDDYLKLQDSKLNTYRNKASADYPPFEDTKA